MTVQTSKLTETSSNRKYTMIFTTVSTHLYTAPPLKKLEQKRLAKKQKHLMMALED